MSAKKTSTETTSSTATRKPRKKSRTTSTPHTRTDARTAAPADAPAKKQAPRPARTNNDAVRADAVTAAVPPSPAPAELRDVPEASAAASMPPAPERPRPGNANPYLPAPATVVEIIRETETIRTLRVVLDDAEAMNAFRFEPGQVGQLSVFGAGESTFVINNPPSQKNYLQFSVMRAGEVTTALHKLSVGDKIGVRAPLGNFFPYQNWKGKHVFFIGGGIGMAPLRTIMLHLLDHRQDYGDISLLYGARSPRDMAFSYELEDWLQRPGLHFFPAVDTPCEGWPHRVGLIPNVLLELAPHPDNCVAVLCGPPIMIKFTVQALTKLGFADENIITTLEKRMKCGIGICGRCNIGHKYVCVDGPVFSWAELTQLPPEL